MAACNAGMKTQTKRNLHAAMAINNFRHASARLPPEQPSAAQTNATAHPPCSSAGLAMYNAANNGLGGNEAHMRMAVTVGLGVLAAAQAVQENASL